MNLQFHFQNISDVLKEDLKEYASKRFEHLERFASTFQEDNKMLNIHLEHYEKHNAYEIKATLQLGGKTLHHEETTHDPKEAIDKTEANLIRQIQKHIDLLREGKQQ